MTGDWVILLAERHSWSLPVDRIEAAWRAAAERYLWNLELSTEALEEISEKIRAASGVLLSRFEVEVFVSGGTLVQILWYRYNRFRKITTAIEDMMDWEIAAQLTRVARRVQGSLLLLLGRRRARLKRLQHRRHSPRRFVEWKDEPQPLIGDTRPYFGEKQPYFVGVRYGKIYEKYLAPKKSMG